MACAAAHGPVSTTDRGRPAHVLLSYHDDERLLGTTPVLDRLAERADPPEGAVLRRWLDESVAAAFDPRVLVVDARLTRRAAALHVHEADRFRDALIGATALTHGMTPVTRNTRDFTRFGGLDLVDPWQPP